MFEAENEGVEVDTQSDASTETSSESPSNETQTEGAKEASSEQQTDNTPFHEHPRFKELVDQKNQAQASYKELQDKVAQLEALSKSSNQQTQSQAQAVKDELIEDLKKVDPRLAERLEKFSKAYTSVESIQQEFNQFKQQQVIQTAVSQINSMHESNKVGPQMKTWINNELDRMYMTGKLNTQNLQNEYKNIHDGFKKWQEDIKRETLKGYVPDKKADSKVPTSQPKGAPAKTTAKAPTFSKDPETARQQVVSRYLKQAQAERESS